jgi:hypothetical protein
MLELLGNDAALHAVPLASDSTPADELVVSRAKHGTAVAGQVNEETAVVAAGTVSFFQVEALVPETQRDPDVVLQYTISGPTEPVPIFPVPPAQQKSPDVVHARVVKVLMVNPLAL